MATDQPGMADGVYFGIARALREAFLDARSVLEIGCGEGKLLRQLAAMFREVHGVDPDEDALRIILEGEFTPRRYLWRMRLGRLPLTISTQLPKAELAVSWQTLEHLEPSEITDAMQQLRSTGTAAHVHSICLAPPESAKRNDPSHTLLRSRAWWLTEFEKAGFVYDDEGDSRLRKAGKFSDGPELFVLRRKG